jgi:predicted CXXCH cytochrome family protein
VLNEKHNFTVPHKWRYQERRGTMKKTVSILAAVAVMAGATMAFAQPGSSDIRLSKHNIPVALPDAGTTQQICVYCHTPHNARMAVPLWNRNVGVAANVFRLYSSQTMAAVSFKTGFTSDSISLFCMSCHDGSPMGGTMVQNQPKNETTTNNTIVNTNTKFETTAANMLSKTHPVNFNIAEGQLRNDGLRDLVWNGTNVYMGNNAAGTFPLFKSARGNFSLECSSCHAVHDDFYAPFLRSTMTGSALCLGCHRK